MTAAAGFSSPLVSCTHSAVTTRRTLLSIRTTKSAGVRFGDRLAVGVDDGDVERRHFDRRLERRLRRRLLLRERRHEMQTAETAEDAEKN